MEDPPQVAQRVGIECVLAPLSEQRDEARDVLAGFLDEQLQELGLDAGGRERAQARHRRRSGRRPPGTVSTGAGCRRRARRRGLGLDPRGAQADDLADRRLERRDRQLGVLEHPPGIAPTGLQHLHVVLERDDGVGEVIESRPGERTEVRQRHAREHAAEPLHDLDGARLLEHQQAGRDAAHQLRHLVESLRLGRRARRLRDRVLDARHVDDAFAQHRIADLPEFLVERRGGPHFRPDRPAG